MSRTTPSLILAITCVVWTAPLGALQEDSEAQVAWLEANAIRLRSIDPADTEFTDLRPVAEAIGDARVVMLGEQTHGDGATFHAKTRLIKFLHQELGFDVLAFEGGFYGMHKAWEALRDGGEVRPAIRRGLNRVWTESEQVQPLFDYIDERARTARPLEIAGFDSQLRAASRETLVAELSVVVQGLEPSLVSSEAWGPVQAALDSLIGGAYYARPISSTQQQRIRNWLDAVTGAIDSANAAPHDLQLAYWRQLLDNIKAHTDAMAAWDPNDSEEFGSIRDEQMARNLIWLTREEYAGRKIIVWAATLHIIRNHRSIDRRRDGLSYDGMTVMGHNAWKDLGEQMYAVGFTAYRGNWGLYNGEAQELPIPPEGSIEDLFGHTTIENALLDFRHIAQGGEWLGQRLLMRPLGNHPMEADWTEVMDAVVFTRTMYASTPTSR